MSEKHRKKKKINRANALPLPIPGRMETFLSQFTGRKEGGPLDAAQDVMYEAWEEQSPSRRIALARKALLISPDCADAYVLLAQESVRSPKVAAELYRKGMEAGERAIGSVKFKEFEGHFWGILETRPYMRARFGLAQLLWELGERGEAVGHYQEMIRLNPNDNQGIRDVLIACLLDLNRNNEVHALLGQYKDDPTAQMAYSSALVAFRMNGDTPQSRNLLFIALQGNRFVPSYLLGAKRIPRNLPDHVGFGDKSEAVAYSGDNMSAWKSTPGALEWLRMNWSAMLADE